MIPVSTSGVSMRRPSWRGVFAGLLMGLIVVMAMAALALVLGSFLSLDLQGAGITAGIYAIITALISAFVAGYFAVKASAPEALFGNGTDIHPKDATLTGILTAASIIVVTSYLTMSGATSVLRGATNAAGAAIGGTASMVAGTAGAVASTAGTAGTVASLASTVGIIDSAAADQARQALQGVTGDISSEDLQAIVAKNLDGIDEMQVKATTAVLEDMLKQTKNEMANLDYTNLDTWKNLDEHLKARMNEVERVIKSDELIYRLQQEGLTREQAVQVRDEAQATYMEYKAKAEQTIAETRQSIEQNVQQALAEAEAKARKAAFYTGLFWLISSLLTFVMAIMGAKKAAANYRYIA